MYIPVCAVSIEPSLHSYKHANRLEDDTFPKNNNEPIYWWLTNACLANSEDLDEKKRISS